MPVHVQKCGIVVVVVAAAAAAAAAVVVVLAAIGWYMFLGVPRDRWTDFLLARAFC